MMGAKYALLVTNLFLLCYERAFMKFLSRESPADIIEAFSSTSRYLDNLLNIDNIYFDQMVDRIYTTDLQLNRLTLCCFVTYSTRRFVLCLALCFLVFLVFLSPFIFAITSLEEERES